MAPKQNEKLIYHQKTNNGHLEYNNRGSDKPLLLESDIGRVHKEQEKSDGNINRTQQGYTGREILKCVILVMSTFVAHTLSTGMSFSLGVYYVEFLSAFNQGSGITSLIGSLNFGALCAAGPLSSIMVHRIGCPNTIIIGGLISSLGIFVCYFARNIYFVLATFGIITGVGYGLVFASCLTQTTCSIHRWRAVCNGLSMAGVGIGIIINPLLTEYLLSSYTWRGALLITSALTMNICVCGFVARIVPEMPTMQEQPEIYVDVDQISSTQLSITDNVGQEKKSFGDYQNVSKKRPSVWSNPLYWCLHINIILFCFGQSIVFTHISAFAFSKGFTQIQASSLISVLGVSNTFGRIMLGVIANLPRINVNILHVVLIISSGLFTLCYTFTDQYLVMACFIALLGIAVSEFGPVLCEVAVKIIGIPDFAHGYGFLLVSMAIGTLLGAPSAGKLYDYTEVYDNSFYLGAASFTVSASMFAVAILVYHIFHTSNKKKEIL